MRSVKMLVVLVLMICVLPVSAQDSQVTDVVCSLENLQNIMNTFIIEIGNLKNGGETDAVVIADKMQTIANAASLYRAACDGLRFEGEAAKVIAPVNFPAGIYRAIVTTDGYFIAAVTATDGECGAGTSYLSSSLFLITEGQANNGSEAVFSSEGCDAILEISNVRQPWTLEFERLSN